MIWEGEMFIGLWNLQNSTTSVNFSLDVRPYMNRREIQSLKVQFTGMYWEEEKAKVCAIYVMLDDDGDENFILLGAFMYK